MVHPMVHTYVRYLYTGGVPRQLVDVMGETDTQNTLLNYVGSPSQAPLAVS